MGGNRGLGHAIFLRICLGSGFLSSQGNPFGKEMYVVKMPSCSNRHQGWGGRKDGDNFP